MLAVAVRPWLWATAIGAMVALAPRRWWRSKPHLPLPDENVLSWRKTTAYGSSSAAMAPLDIVSYLEWRRANVP